MKRFAILGIHLARQCGIAAFTTHHTINRYYGADTRVALAAPRISRLCGWLDRHGDGA